METITIGDGLTLHQDKAGLKFGTDALLLAAYIRKCGFLVEYGAGSGAVSLLAASRGRADRVAAIEIQARQYELLCKNILENDLCDNIEPLHLDLREYRPSRHPDAVAANPPFMKIDSGFPAEDDGKNAARHEIHGGIGDFCRNAGAILGTGGAFYCVYRPDRLPDLLAAMRDSGLGLRRMTMVHHSISHPASLVLCEGRRSGKDDVFVTRPLILYESGGEKILTPDYRRIYETGEFDESFLRTRNL
ncbi:MAG: methyltransferase [Clostridiales bacterium]|jgi:tRNA1Val (adenine37-N6)-methyltransferase|nr:methyltransferase [Clostridiales bacterium]